MTDTPLFTDTSTAGYDHTCHQATIQLAADRGLDVRDPAHQLLIAQRLTTWAEKLRRHATLSLPADHDPSTDSRSEENPNPTTRRDLTPIHRPAGASSPTPHQVKAALPNRGWVG